MKIDKVMISIALVISVVALIIAWTSYNRSGLDLSRQAELQLQEDSAKLQRTAALVEARIRLTAIRTEITAEDFSEELADEVDSIRSDLRETYENTGEDIDENLRELDSNLEELSFQIRDESADAINTLNTLIEDLRKDVSTTPKERCTLAGGEWQEFPNSCVDSCELARNPAVTQCAQVLTEGCECGENSCWNGVTCEPI